MLAEMPGYGGGFNFVKRPAFAPAVLLDKAKKTGQVGSIELIVAMAIVAIATFARSCNYHSARTTPKAQNSE